MSAPIVLAQAGGDFFRDRSQTNDSCVAGNGFCPNWIVHHLDRYVSPFWQHLYLVVVSVGLGFAIAFALALAAHRQRALVGPITQVTGILYTIPSLAFFFLLLPITGRGNTTALIALTAYTLLILFRNIVDGLDGVPDEARDAGRGMGLTYRQLLWRVELPLALPAIVAGLRIAVVSTIALATVAAFVVSQGLGVPILGALRDNFKTEILVAGALAVGLAFIADGILVLVQRALTPWATSRRTA
jgi:osmoprotectant transport system permease protein